MFYSITMNRNCNFNCTYCYQHDKKNICIETDTLKKICEFIIKHSLDLMDSSIDINISGGECLLYSEKIKFFICLIKEELSKYKLPAPNIEISTNASLLTEELIEFFAVNDCMLYIGFDGVEKIQNLNRKMLNSNDSYSLCLSKLEMLKKNEAYNKIVTINSVITSNNVEYLCRNFEFLKGTFQKFRFSFNFAYNSKWNRKSLQMLETELKKLAELYIKYIKTNKTFSLNLFDRQIKMCLKSYFNQKPQCNAIESSIGFTPEGYIIVCGTCLGLKAEQSFIIGDVDFGVNEEKKQQLLRNKQITHFKCKKCVYENKCYNYCPSSNFLAGSKLFKPSTTLCKLNRILIKVSEFILNSLCEIDFDIVKNKFWDD